MIKEVKSKNLGEASRFTPDELKFKYKRDNITFMVDDCILVNATEMGNVYFKNVHDYLRQDATLDLINYLKKINKRNKSYTLIKTEQTGKDKVVWLNAELAMDYAAWLNLRFHKWCIQTMDFITDLYMFHNNPDFKDPKKLRAVQKWVDRFDFGYYKGLNIKHYYLA